MAVLSQEQIRRELEKLDGWRLDGDEITKTYVTKDFVDSIAFTLRVAFIAERLNHHPDIAIRWNKVTLSASTHSEGGITEKDFELARAVDEGTAA